VCSSDLILEVQKAKAAIYAGCVLLMRQRNIRADRINRFVVAGAFGHFLDKESAVIVGMLPDVSLDRIEEVGNASGTGAKMALVSLEKRQEAERIAESTDYHEVAMDPSFAEVYTRAMLFSMTGDTRLS
jgi:uncharacterized 2Fe-2S/4Fe-4S cluster protein (DUF4445 family)